MTAPEMLPALALAAKAADGDAAPDVDLMILDFLLYKATEALLSERAADRDGRDLDEHERPELPLQMVDSWLHIFKAKHPSIAVPDCTHYRLRLLKFAALYTRRLQARADTLPQESLDQIRKANASRAVSFSASSRSSPSASSSPSSSPAASSALRTVSQLNTSALPLSFTDLQHHRTLTLEALHIQPESTSERFYGTPACTSLRDLSPLFLGVSAARRALDDWKVTPRWMDLTAEWLLQSVLEQYLVCGAAGQGPLVEAFGWGWRRDRGSGSVGGVKGDEVEERLLNELFREEDELDEMEGWKEVVERTIQKLTPTPSEPFLARLQSAATAHPVAAFDSNILKFIRALQSSLSPPLIAQLEAGGAIDGLSLRETEAFKQRVGLRA